MDNPLDCTWDEFRVIARDFLQAAPTAIDCESLEAGWHALAVSYIHCKFDETSLGEHNRKYSAPILLRICGREFFKRQFELMEQHD